MISYAQVLEDVVLHRALHHVSFEQGFYIDVGAYDPERDSVTKHFYDHGWRGINIEPSRDLFEPFRTARPRDINLQVAVSDRTGDVTFYAVDGQLGTLQADIAERHSQAGIGTSAYTVPAQTLAAICQAHVTGDIHFLKIDVEGHEEAALRGMDFVRYRPWILVIEATEPNRIDLPTHDQWEAIVITAGYKFVMTDRLNRYYVANERMHLAAALAFPADDYVRNVHQQRTIELERALAAR